MKLSSHQACTTQSTSVVRPAAVISLSAAPCLFTCAAASLQSRCRQSHRSQSYTRAHQTLQFTVADLRPESSPVLHSAVADLPCAGDPISSTHSSPTRQASQPVLEIRNQYINKGDGVEEDEDGRNIEEKKEARKQQKKIKEESHAARKKKRREKKKRRRGKLPNCP